MNGIEISLSQKQELKLTPQLLQSLGVLQMTAGELLDHLKKQAEENPVIELSEPDDLRESFEKLRRDAAWADAGDRFYGAGSGTGAAAGSGAGAGSGESFDPVAGAAAPEAGGPLDSLAWQLRDQIRRMGLPKQQAALAEYLTGLLDEDAFLETEDLEDLSKLGLGEDLIREAVSVLQSLEPAGIGAANLTESLVIQIRRRQGLSDSVRQAAETLVRTCMGELARKQFPAIHRKTGLPIDLIREAAGVISELDPHPGRDSSFEPPVYVRPDVFILEKPEPHAVLNEFYLPRVSVSDYYRRLLRSAPDQETKAYLADKIKQADGLISGLSRRGATIQRIADEIAGMQAPFFSGASNAIAPSTMRSLADRLGLNASTISRAVRGKYLQCRRGLYPLRFFISPALAAGGLAAGDARTELVRREDPTAPLRDQATGGALTAGGSAVSRQTVKLALAELVRGEDPTAPLSDQAIRMLLAERGMRVSRRTLAKYRQELGIPSSYARRR